MERSSDRVGDAAAPGHDSQIVELRRSWAGRSMDRPSGRVNPNRGVNAASNRPRSSRYNARRRTGFRGPDGPVPGPELSAIGDRVLPMRIIAGLRRGHKFDGPSGHSKTRPTSDFVRESIFNILGDEVVDRPVLDLFSGTGALGFEALSRGASHATLVECDRDQVALIKRNLTILKLADQGTVVPVDAYRFLRTFRPADATPLVAFLDPPYAEYQNHPNRFYKGVSLLLSKAPVGSIVVVEAPDRMPGQVLPEPERWELHRYGSTVIALRRVTGEEDAPVAEADSPSAANPALDCDGSER